MSRYEELRRAFSEYQDAERKFVTENEAIANQIVSGLREYLEMPLTFPSPEIGGGTLHKSYTPLYSVDENGETTEANFLAAALTHLTDGTFRFAFGVVLERAAGAFPKKKLIVNVVCRRDDGKVTIDISGEKVICTFDGTKCPDIEKAHSLIMNLLMKWLQHRPGDGRGFSHFGFRMGN
jgi:hypothetical protein